MENLPFVVTVQGMSKEIDEEDISNLFLTNGCSHIFDVTNNGNSSIWFARFHLKRDFEIAENLNGSKFRGRSISIEKLNEETLNLVPEGWLEKNCFEEEEDEDECSKLFQKLMNSRLVSFTKFLDYQDSRFCRKKKEKSKPKFIDISKKLKSEQKSETTLRFIVLSDTHGRHNRVSLEEGDRIQQPVQADVLLHCGDFTDHSAYTHILEDSEGKTFYESPPPKSLVDFNKYLGTLDRIDRKLIVSGNHDLAFKDSNDGSYTMKMRKKYLSNGEYLNNESVVIKGVKIHGLAFNDKSEDHEVRKRRIDAIPKDTNILICHFAPIFGRCCDLFFKTQMLKRLKVVCFGHFHYRHFSKKIGNVLYISAPCFPQEGYRRTNSTFCFDYPL